MSNATMCFNVMKPLGIFADLKRVSVSRYDGQWEVWGHFQNENGRRNGRIAQFDEVTDAVDFEVLLEQDMKK